MPKKILAVDDERHIVRLVQVNLERAGYQVVTAFDGKEALQKVEAEQPDLVVLDVMMPYMTGLDVLAKIRADARWRAVPCIVLTAAGQEQHHKHAMALGANEFLTKPFSPKKLYARAAELAGVSSEELGAGDR